MSENDIVQKLDRLANLEAHIDVIRLRFNELRSNIIPEEIRAQLAEIDAEEKTALEAAEKGVAQLRRDIQKAVLTLGESVKGEYMMAVWNKARETWDSKALVGYSAAHPEIEKFKKVGNPSVSFRRTNK